MELNQRDQVSDPIIEDYNGQTVEGAVNGGSTTIMGNQANMYGVPPAGTEPAQVNTNGAPSYIPAQMQQQQPQQYHQPQQQQPRYDPSIPVSELFELEDKFVIMLDMPGLDKNSIDIKYDHPQITIQAIRPSIIDIMKDQYGQSLLQNSARKYYGKMSAGFNINKNIDNVEAEYTDGVLVITAIFKQKGEISVKLK